MSTIRMKLILWFLVVGLIPMGVSMSLMYQFSSEKMIEKEQTSMQGLALSTSEGMNQWLDKRVSEMQLAAKTDGMVSLDPKRQLQLVKQVKEQSPSYETVVFTDPKGMVRAHTTEKNIGVMNLADRDYFVNGMQGKQSISSILISKTTGNRVVVVATPVKGTNEEVVGVMSATINFEDLIQPFLLTSNLNKNGILPILVDDQKRIQVSPQKEIIGKRVAESGLGTDMIALLSKEKLETGHNVIDDHGEEFVFAYAPIELTGYQLYLQVPLSSVLAAADEMKQQTLILITVSAMGICLVAWLIARSVSSPIQAITAQAKRVAEGDLTGQAMKVTTRDEIAQLTHSFNDMQHSLKSLIHQVQSSSEYVAESSVELMESAEQTSKMTQQITLAIEQVSVGADQQNLGVTESVRALQEVSQGVQQIAYYSTSISETSHYTIQRAHDGGESVQRTVNQMQSIHSSVSESDQIIKSLDERSKEIGKILDVVTGIAAQTNLLALNAAIEAARAGEHGRGFAVVADEVRKLAEESHRSSNQIGEYIAEMQRDVTCTINAMGHIKDKVDEGITVANDTKRSFAEIIQAAREVASQIENMAASAQHMSAGSQQVNASFAEIARISQETTASTQEVSSSAQEQLASMEEITSSAESLSHLALELRKMISTFKI